jgi:hypothetical protein
MHTLEKLHTLDCSTDCSLALFTGWCWRKSKGRGGLRRLEEEGVRE